MTDSKQGIDLLSEALTESGVSDEKNRDDLKTGGKQQENAENMDKVDWFSQALFMLDESNVDIPEEPAAPVEPVKSEPAKIIVTESSPFVTTSQPLAATQPAIAVKNGSDVNGKEQIITVKKPVLGQSHSIVVPKAIMGGQRSIQQIIAEVKNERGLIRNGSAPVLGNLPIIQINNGIPAVLSSKDVSRMWSNDDIKTVMKTPGLPQLQAAEHIKTIEEEEEADDEEEELGRAETYADYMPSKLNIGVRHPDPVVETSSLSSVEPPDVWYKLRIPEEIIDSGDLSALQLEAITYTCQRHETMLSSGERAGYLIGDGAGVGKGRTVAGVIYESYLCDRKRSLWFSVSNDLKVDAERDLRDIGAGKIQVYSLNKLKYAKISSQENGSIKKGVLFSTYSSLIGESTSSVKYKTRMKMILNWCGADFDGVIVFDECHKAKNLCPSGSAKPTKTGMAVVDLQKKLPKARIVYASATGASEPRNMAYMTRLGLWGLGTPFREFTDFIQAVERRGVGAMELVAMDMKLRGMYIARQLSFQGVTFKIEDIPVPKDFVKVYNAAVKVWVDAREKFVKAADLIDAEKQMRKSMWGQFWSAHQRFFKYLCISAKVKFAVKLANEALKAGKCVVVGLQSTGEARTLEQLEEMGGELTDFVSTAKGVLQALIEKHFPAPDRKKAFDIFGLEDKSNSIFDDVDIKNILEGRNGRRKAVLKTGSGSRKTRFGRSSIYNEKNSSDSESGDESEFEPSESEEESDSEEDDDESDGDNFNPFGDLNSDEDDPWIKKSKNKSIKRKKVPKQKPAKRKKKEKHKSSRKDKSESSDTSDDDDIEELMENIMNRSSTADQSKEKSNTASGGAFTTEEARQKATDMKRELLESLERLGDKLPANTLDELVDSFGGTDNVAEMTGRKGRVVSDECGNISYELRSAQDVPLEILNLTEKQRFMDGEKLVAIISEAASSGISLQADRRVNNQRRRVHITLELPWSADRAIQQFGRTHRSNQVSAPEYMFLISELAGERRFASTVAKRLECLGALTHGDRRATESRDLSQFNVDNKYGRAALEIVMKSIIGQDRPMVPTPKNYQQGDFMEDVKLALVGVGLISMDNQYKIAMLEKDYNVISKFLNRILGTPVELQNALFQYFTDTLHAVILQAKRNGRWDLGILDLGAGGEYVKVLRRQTFERQYGGSAAHTELVTVSVERGLSWEAAMGVWQDHIGSDDGFYITSSKRQGKTVAILAVAMTGGKKKERLYQVYRPNTGLIAKMETISDLKKRYKRITPDEAEDYWLEQYESSANTCTHAFWRGNCKRIAMGMTCEIGLRTRTYHVLTGSVLSVWNKVEMVIATMPGATHNKMQIIRLRTQDGKRIVGTLIPTNCLEPLSAALRQPDPDLEQETSSGSGVQNKPAFYEHKGFQSMA